MKAAWLLILIASIMPGCVAVTSLPESTSAVEFGTGQHGRIGQQSYREEAVFEKATVDKVLAAAKNSLQAEKFNVAREGSDFILGEHGATWVDWNIIAGIYLRQKGDAVEAVIRVEASKDTGMHGDVTAEPWTDNILAGMRRSLADTSAHTRP